MEKSSKISENDCNQVLSEYYKDKPYKLVKFSYGPISEEINGYMSEHLLLKITVENNPKSELRFFAKVLSDQDIVVEFAKAGNVFNKEVHCYKFFDDVKSVYPAFDASFIPKYYYSRDEEVIILQDISDSGYKMWSKSLDLDLEHIKLTLKATARFHSASLIFEEIKSKAMGRKYQLTEDYGEWLQESLYLKKEDFLGFRYITSGIKGLCALTDHFKKTLTPREFKTRIWDLSVQVYEDIKPSKKFRNVWCNGDLWTKNVMFKYENGTLVDCKIFDFQLQRYNPPAHDVLFMIYQTADRKTRQKYFDYLLDYYYDNLKQELEEAGFNIDNILSKDEFDLSIQYVFPTIKLIKAIYKSLSAASTDSFKKILANPEDYSNITFGDRSNFVVNEFKNVLPYRNIMTILLEDLEDVLTHDKVTIEHCHKILHQKLNSSEYIFGQYNTIPYSKGISRLTIQIRFQDNKEVTNFTFLVKEYSKEYSKEFEQEFFREFKLFNNVLPKLMAKDQVLIENGMANCYLKLLNNIMVFDDYSAQGYEYWNLAMSDYKIVRLVITKLARMHACGFIADDSVKNTLQDYFGSNCNGVDQAMLKEILTRINFYPGQEKYFNRAMDIPNTASTMLSKYGKTLCHGSLYSNNILIKYENAIPKDCVFVNFGNVRFSSPACDLMPFLYLTTDRQFRSQYLHELLDVYYWELSKILECRGSNVNCVLPHNEFLASCEDIKEYALLQAVVQFGKIKLDKIKEDAEEISINGYSLDKRMQECFEEIRKLCE